MILAKSKDGPIHGRYKKHKGKVDNVWEEALRQPERTLEFRPMKLDRCEEV